MKRNSTSTTQIKKMKLNTFEFLRTLLMVPISLVNTQHLTHGPAVKVFTMDVDWDKVKKVITAFDIEIYPLEECTIGYCIGNGSAMEVLKGQCKINMVYKDVAFKRHRAFKTYKPKQRDVNSALEDFRHEIKLMRRLKHHTNVVQIYGVTFEARKPVLIVELCHDTIDKYLLEKAELDTPASWREKFKLCDDTARGLRSLHEVDIIHGDIKGANILVFTKDTGIPTAKISDFGYSTTLTSSKKYIGGTQIFMAPEARGIQELEPWAKEQTQDIFSFGIVTCQIASDGKMPYENTEDPKKSSKADPTNRHTEILLLSLPPDTPEVFRKIIIETTKYMPTERASLDIVEQILYDGFDTPSSQQAMDISLTSSHQSNYEKAKFAFESYAVYNYTGITSPNELSIPSVLKEMIFSDYQQLSENGDGLMLYMLGKCLQHGFGTEMNVLKAVECFMKAAEAGVTAAQNNLGFCCENGIGTPIDYTKAIEFYTKAAEAEDAMAQCNLGFCYEEGRGSLAKNINQAIELYTKSAQRGNALAYYFLGRCHESGSGVAKDIMKAVELYQIAAEIGNMDAQVQLGNCYFQGSGVTQDYNKAVDLFTKAAEAGVSMAQRNLGYCYQYGNGLTKDEFKAVELYTKAAEAGNPMAQNNLGFCYENGIGTPVDHIKAVEFYTKAAEAGVSMAQHNLGRCYQHGNGVAKDEFKAVEWYTKAAEAENAIAQNDLAFCYEKGTRIPRDYSKAFEWYKKGAEGGNTLAQYNLGRCYQYSIGVMKDEFKAVEWYTKAAEAGNAMAQNNLGLCYESSIGIPRDYRKAIKYYTNAANAGFIVAQQNLDRLKKKVRRYIK